MTKRRSVTAVVTTVAILIVGFVAYGAWTRRSPVRYSHGGPFASASSAPVVTGGPATGRYVYDGRGHEDVVLGGLSVCGWNVDGIDITVKRDAGKTVLDQQIGGRIERAIHDYRAGGVYLTYSASTVTCLGIRTTSEDLFSPPVLRFRSPMRAGDAWTTHTTSPNRTEDATVTVLRAETLTVPAGRFDTFVVRLAARLSGGQTGTVDVTYWFQPRLGIWVKEEFASRATRSGARFTSSFTTELRSLPG